MRSPPARRSLRLLARIAVALAVMATGQHGIARAAKTDLVILFNGDHITGEVKGLARGKLDYSTDDAGRPSIEWVKVARVTSPNIFEVEAASGARYIGSLGAAATEGFLVVRGARADTLRIATVVGISPLSAGFVQRLKAYLDVGFTVAKANDAKTFSLDTEAEYRGERLGGRFSFDSYSQDQESTPISRRNSAAQTLSWFLPARWSAIVLAQVEQNDELDLAHRILAGGGGGRVLGQSNQFELSAGAGLVGTWEEFYPAAGGATSASVEGLLFASWDAFRFDSPKLDFSTQLSVYPSISQAGRVRGQLDLRLKYELFKDFDAGIGFTDTFDSEPPEESISKNDYVTTLTIGWSYRR